MKCTIVVEMDNDAFVPDPTPELCRILRDLADGIDGGEHNQVVRDSNGNKCGYLRIR